MHDDVAPPGTGAAFASYLAARARHAAAEAAFAGQRPDLLAHRGDLRRLGEGNAATFLVTHARGDRSPVAEDMRAAFDRRLEAAVALARDPDAGRLLVGAGAGSLGHEIRSDVELAWARRCRDGSAGTLLAEAGWAERRMMRDPATRELREAQADRARCALEPAVEDLGKALDDCFAGASALASLIHRRDPRLRSDLKTGFGFADDKLRCLVDGDLVGKRSLARFGDGLAREFEERVAAGMRDVYGPGWVRMELAAEDRRRMAGGAASLMGFVQALEAKATVPREPARPRSPAVERV